MAVASATPDSKNRPPAPEANVASKASCTSGVCALEPERRASAASRTHCHSLSPRICVRSGHTIDRVHEHCRHGVADVEAGRERGVGLEEVGEGGERLAEQAGLTLHVEDVGQHPVEFGVDHDVATTREHRPLVTQLPGHHVDEASTVGLTQQAARSAVVDRSAFRSRHAASGGAASAAPRSPRRPRRSCSGRSVPSSGCR